MGKTCHGCNGKGWVEVYEELNFNPSDKMVVSGVIRFHFTVTGSKKAAEVATSIVELTGRMVCIWPLEKQTYLLITELIGDDEFAKVRKFLDESL